MDSYTEKLQRCHGYVAALEEEKKKVLVFQRELPLCLGLVTQAIAACKKELSGTTAEYIHGGSECSEQTNSSDGIRPIVLEEFIPIKRTSSCSEDSDGEERRSNTEKQIDHRKKSDWLRSVQLWSNQSPDLPAGEAVPRKAVVTEVKRGGGGFQPFHKGKTAPAWSNQVEAAKVPASSTSSTAETGTSGGGVSDRKLEEKKQRRCWSPELHRRFLHALQQLGGSQAATPKQIRELMKVDGLTNDEVKSHLQKYRLHTRRPNPANNNINNNNSNPQFVVVGGIWVPPPEHSPTANRIYAPIAAPPPPPPDVSKSEERRGSHCHSEGGGAHSNSPSSTSSSTHTTTNSLVL